MKKNHGYTLIGIIISEASSLHSKCSSGKIIFYLSSTFLGLTLNLTYSRLENTKLYIHYNIYIFRSATGENWHNIMLACSTGALCDPDLPAVKARGDEFCGSSLAHAYFISFIFVCSFLVSTFFFNDSIAF